MHVLTVVNKDHVGLDLWKRSAEKAGLVPTILWAPPFSKLGHESAWFGQKFVTLDKHLQNLPEDDLCLITDGFDVVFVGNPEEEIRKFGAPLLFAAEKYENPDQGRPYSGNHTFKYLNSGVYAGTVKEIRRALKPALDMPNVLELDDQRYFTNYFFSSGRIVLDHEAKVFACLAGTPLFLGPKVLHFQGFYKDTKPLCQYVDEELCSLAMKLHRVPNFLTPLWDAIKKLGSLVSKQYSFPVGLAIVLLFSICIVYETNARR
jgi:hypothetical protein